MKHNAQDFYNLIAGNKFKKITDILQDGVTGMYYLLKILDESKSDMNAGEISERLGVTTARTAVLISSLDSKGYISKAKSVHDARQTLVSLTPLGKQVLEERKNYILGTIENSLGKLSGRETQALYKIIQKLVETH